MSAAKSLPDPTKRRDVDAVTPLRPLGPGAVLVELSLSTTIPKRVLFEGLRAMGFLAVALAFIEDNEVLDGDEPEDDDRPDAGMTARFIGKLAREIVPTNTDVIEWIERSPISIDVFRPIESLAKVFVVPFVLESKQEYELRFVSRYKLFPEADNVADALEAMGFHVHELIALRSKLLTNLDEDERDAYGVWFARAEWQGNMSVVTPEDDFYFSDLKKLPRADIRHVERKGA